MHIEIIGMSGAGKSTLIMELLKSDKFLNGRSAIYDYSLIKRLFKRRVILKNEALNEFEEKYKDVFNLFLSSYELSNSNWVEFSKKLNWLSDTALAHFLTTEKNKPVIIDESFIHRGLSFCEFGASFLDSYVKLVPYPDMLFILDISKEELLNRRVERDGVIFKNLLEENGIDWFFSHVKKINKITDMFEKVLIENDVTVIRLNAELSLIELKNTILNEVFNKKRHLLI